MNQELIVALTQLGALGTIRIEPIGNTERCVYLVSLSDMFGNVIVNHTSTDLETGIITLRDRAVAYFENKSPSGETK